MPPDEPAIPHHEDASNGVGDGPPHNARVTMRGGEVTGIMCGHRCMMTVRSPYGRRNAGRRHMLYTHRVECGAMTLGGVRVKHGMCVWQARVGPSEATRCGAMERERPGADTTGRTGVGDNAHMDVGICLKRRLHPFTIA